MQASGVGPVLLLYHDFTYDAVCDPADEEQRRKKQGIFTSCNGGTKKVSMEDHCMQSISLERKSAVYMVRIQIFLNCLI